jgi:hypothetical protein
LDRHVECRRWLVREENVGIRGERYGNRHALSQASAELVGKLFEPLLGVRDADLVQQLTCMPLGRTAAFSAVYLERFGDLTLDGQQWVE